MSATNNDAARSASGTANIPSDAAAKAPMPAVSRPRFSPGRAVLTLFLTLLSLLWLIPLAFILINSFKGKLFISESPFALPNGESSVGLNN